MWQDDFGKNPSKTPKFIVSRLITKICKVIDYKRTKHFRSNTDIKKYYAGSSWWSLTQDGINLLKDKKDWALRRFKNTSCCDEVFAQTIILNSDLASKIYKVESNDCYEECMRYVNFNGNSPYVLNIDNYDDLENSNYLFARKFGTNTMKECELVDRITNKYK